MITEYEKEKAIQYSDELASILVNNEEGALYYKILANFIAKSNPDFEAYSYELTQRDEMIRRLSTMISYMVTVASEKSTQKLYTTGQLSKYFGVSITSINNWVKENRFIGVQRNTRNKQIRIPENSWWRSSSGELISVKTVIEMWNKEHASRNDSSKETEKSLLESDLQFFEKKYNGTYEQTLLLKEQMTDAEQRDMEEWAYLLKRVSDD